eukprot:TRINITY_DN22163_c0_g1_i1.p1 TRINITY_DN22163_c0_g1~~TRINITY_DN22163_c0_g1_i1.p1  ORF type:complete len:102 (-),score=18.17 TRINITY_DN22163_c0_g1_i1:124-429(-)
MEEGGEKEAKKKKKTTSFTLNNSNNKTTYPTIKKDNKINSSAHQNSFDLQAENIVSFVCQELKKCINLMSQWRQLLLGRGRWRNSRGNRSIAGDAGDDSQE